MVRQYVKYELYTHPNKIKEKMDAFPVFQAYAQFSENMTRVNPPES